MFQQSTSHAPLEPRSALAYWQNGKLYLFGSTQSVAQSMDAVARWCGVPSSQLVFVSEYCGGGFGGKINGSPVMAVPALLMVFFLIERPPQLEASFATVHVPAFGTSLQFAAVARFDRY